MGNSINELLGAVCAMGSSYSFCLNTA